MLYSRTARADLISLTAMTLPATLTNRTTWREIPRGRAARCSSVHSASGTDHGRSSNAGSGLAAVISSAICLSWHVFPTRRSGQSGHGQRRRGRRPPGTQPPSAVCRCYTRRSVAEAQAGLGVEQVHVLALLGGEVDDGALLGRGATVDAHDDRLDVAGGLGGRAVDVGVGPELFNDIDGDRQALALHAYREVLGTDTEGDLLALAGQEVALAGVGGRAELHAAVNAGNIEQAH